MDDSDALADWDGRFVAAHPDSEFARTTVHRRKLSDPVYQRFGRYDADGVCRLPGEATRVC